MLEINKHINIYKLIFTILQNFANEDAIFLYGKYNESSMSLYEIFKEWWKLYHGHHGMPKGKQLFDYITNKFGAKKGRSWKGISLIKDQESEDEMSEL